MTADYALALRKFGSRARKRTDVVFSKLRCSRFVVLLNGVDCNGDNADRGIEVHEMDVRFPCSVLLRSAVTDSIRLTTPAAVSIRLDCQTGQINVNFHG